MSITGRFFVTPHAVERYIERIHPGIKYEQALREILEHADRAHRVKEIEPGVSEWRARPPLRLRFRIAEHGPDLPQVLTVLKPSESWQPR